MTYAVKDTQGVILFAHDDKHLCELFRKAYELGTGERATLGEYAPTYNRIHWRRKGFASIVRPDNSFVGTLTQDDRGDWVVFERERKMATYRDFRTAYDYARNLQSL